MILDINTEARTLDYKSWLGATSTKAEDDFIEFLHLFLLVYGEHRDQESRFAIRQVLSIVLDVA